MGQPGPAACGVSRFKVRRRVLTCKHRQGPAFDFKAESARTGAGTGRLTSSWSPLPGYNSPSEEFTTGAVCVAARVQQLFNSQLFVGSFLVRRDLTYSNERSGPPPCTSLLLVTPTECTMPSRVQGPLRARLLALASRVAEGRAPLPIPANKRIDGLHRFCK